MSRISFGMGLGIVVALMLAVGEVQAAQCDPAIPANTPNSRFMDNGDGTVTDNTTGLMWKQCAEGLSGAGCVTGSAATYTWQQALQEVQTVNSGGGFAGYTDWRLPNMKELHSIVEGQCHTPAINATLFPNTVSDYFWTNSPYANAVAELAWAVKFDDGLTYFLGQIEPHYVRIVRGGS